GCPPDTAVRGPHEEGIRVHRADDGRVDGTFDGVLLRRQAGDLTGEDRAGALLDPGGISERRREAVLESFQGKVRARLATAGIRAGTVTAGASTTREPGPEHGATPLLPGGLANPRLQCQSE